MKILFTGDINFRGLEDIDYSKSAKILADVKPYIEKSDFVIPNLECPLGDRDKYSPIKKAGPNLICPENAVSFLKAMNAYAVTAANNHIGDYGGKALENTLALLSENGIKHTGAGSDITKAYEAIRIHCGGVSVSVLSVCENEFGVATDTTHGSAGYNARRLLAALNREKTASDYVAVAFHGGSETNPLPSPDTVDRYKLICDMGADAVIGCHTHCPQGYEIYGGKPIIYSMGNFLFKNDSVPDGKNSWYYGYITILDIGKSGISLEIVPYKFDKISDKIKVFDGKEKEAMIDYINHLSQIIQDPTKLSNYFKGWCMEHLWIPFLPKDLNDLTDYDSASNYDLLKCESHLSQAKQIFEILFNGEVKAAEKYKKIIPDLQKMPI